MRAVRNALVFLLAGVLMVGIARAATTTNYSGQWWVPSEPGWGTSVQQQSDVLVVDLLVYGADGNPTWLTAAASLQSAAAPGHDTFAGDLYETAGPHYAGAFDPSSVTSRKVGTLSFDAANFGNAVLAYTVDGVAVAKSLARETWAYENLSGTYDAVWSFGCGAVGSSPAEWGFTETVVRHDADNSVAIAVALWATFYEVEHHLRGTYAQFGHMGVISSSFVAPESGSLTISEIETTATGFSGRIPPAASSTCQKDGRIVAVRRP